jgi:hypothetical protein
MPEVLYDDQHEIISPSPVKPIRAHIQCKLPRSPSSATLSEIVETDEGARDAEMSAPYFATDTPVIQKEPVFTGYVIGESHEQDAQLVAPFGQFFHEFDGHSAYGPSPMDSNFSCDSIPSPDGQLLSLPGDQIPFSNSSGVHWGHDLYTHDHYAHDQQFLFTIGNDEPPPAPDLYSNLAFMPIEEPRKYAPMTCVIDDCLPDSY